MSMLQTFLRQEQLHHFLMDCIFQRIKKSANSILKVSRLYPSSLKGVNGNTFDEAPSCLVKVINRGKRVDCENSSESENLTQVDMELFENCFLR